MIRLIVDGALEELRLRLPTTLTKYSEDERWIDDYMGDAAWCVDWPASLDAMPELIVSANENDDRHNAINLHRALKGLPRRIVSDERFWAYATHHTYWPYMRMRWDLNARNRESMTKQRKVQFLIERYFFHAGNRERALVRNGIARLFWFAQVAYDPSLDNEYELLDQIFAKQDIASALCERSISRCNNLSLAVLHVLKQQSDEGNPFINREREFRPLMRSLNLFAATTLIDSLSFEELLTAVQRQISNIRSPEYQHLE